VNNHNEIREMSYDFSADAPIYRLTPSDSISGTIAAAVRFKGGESGSVTATFGQGIYEIDYKGPDGKVSRFRSDRNGVVVQ
jgi:hypothetical protein